MAAHRNEMDDTWMKNQGDANVVDTARKSYSRSLPKFGPYQYSPFSNKSDDNLPNIFRFSSMMMISHDKGDDSFGDVDRNFFGSKMTGIQQVQFGLRNIS